MKDYRYNIIAESISLREWFWTNYDKHLTQAEKDKRYRENLAHKEKAKEMRNKGVGASIAAGLGVAGVGLHNAYKNKSADGAKKAAVAGMATGLGGAALSHVGSAIYKWRKQGQTKRYYRGKAKYRRGDPLSKWMGDHERKGWLDAQDEVGALVRKN